MINRGLIRKNLRDSLLPFLFCAVGLIAFSFLFVGAMQTMGKELLAFVSKFPLLVKIFEMGFGIKVGDSVSLQVLFGVCFTHLVTLSLSWIIVITCAMRPIVGEIENGTADQLLTLPVTRTQVFASNLISWIPLSVLAAFCPVLGIWLATLILGSDEPIEFSRYVPVALNLFALSFAVGGICSLVSAVSTKKSFVIGVVLTVCVSSVTLNFIEPFFPALGFFRYLNLLNFFRPVDVIKESAIPWFNISVLLALGLVTWLVGLVYYLKRDIPAE